MLARCIALTLALGTACYLLLYHQAATALAPLASHIAIDQSLLTGQITLKQRQLTTTHHRILCPSMTLTLDPWALLQGRLHTRSVHLHQPTFELHDTLIKALPDITTALSDTLTQAHPFLLRITDGTLISHDVTLRKLNVDTTLTQAHHGQSLHPTHISAHLSTHYLPNSTPIDIAFIAHHVEHGWQLSKIKASLKLALLGQVHTWQLTGKAMVDHALQTLTIPMLQASDDTLTIKGKLDYQPHAFSADITLAPFKLKALPYTQALPFEKAWGEIHWEPDAQQVTLHLDDTEVHALWPKQRIRINHVTLPKTHLSDLTAVLNTWRMHWPTLSRHANRLQMDITTLKLATLQHHDVGLSIQHTPKQVTIQGHAQTPQDALLTFKAKLTPKTLRLDTNTLPMDLTAWLGYLGLNHPLQGQSDGSLHVVYHDAQHWRINGGLEAKLTTPLNTSLLKQALNLNTAWLNQLSQSPLDHIRFDYQWQPGQLRLEQLYASSAESTLKAHVFLNTQTYHIQAQGSLFDHNQILKPNPFVISTATHLRAIKHLLSP